MNESIENPTVSIGMPVYNGETFLARSLESLVNQTYADVEIIISDNGSNDATEAICREFAARHTNIRYIRHESNAGAAWNFNYVFSLARGKYFKWAAADDVLAPTYLAHLVPILEEHPTVVVAYSRAMLIDENDEVVRVLDDRLNRRQSTASLRIQDYSPGACNPVFGLIRHSALTNTSLIGPYPSSDMILLWQLLLLGEFYEEHEILFLRRSHPSSSVRANPDFRSRMKWFAPDRRAVFYLPTANRIGRYATAIAKSNLEPGEKLRCYAVLGKRYILNPKWIVRDFSIAAQELVGFNPMKQKRNLV